jgi:hypothetical protein
VREWDFSSLSLLEKEDDMPSSIFTCSGNFGDILLSGAMVSCDATSNNNATDDSLLNLTSCAKTSLEAEFIETFRRADLSLPTSITTLSNLLLHFPKLIYVVPSETSNELELHFWREQLLQALFLEEAKFPGLVFTSFERGLKHAGMEVTQSTHGGRKVKKWAIRKDWDSKPVRKTSKRKDKDDDVERPHKKLK